MKLRSIFFSALCMVALGAGFTSCDDDDDENIDDTQQTTTGGGDSSSARVAYILNEGSMGMNNASLGRLSLTDYSYQGYWYMTKNGLQLGDQAQDIKAYDGHLYLAVSGSKYVAKLDKEGNEVARCRFDANQGNPRSLVVTGGKVFVTSYSGQLHQLDASSLVYEKSLQVAETGIRLEGLAERDGKLYVAVAYKVIPATEPGAWDTYVYQNQVAVVDAATLTRDTVLTVVSNPSVLASCGDGVYLYSIGDYYMEQPAIQHIGTDNTVRTLPVTANKMSVVGDKLFLVNAVTVYAPDYSSSTTENTFLTYNTTTDEVGGDFMTGAPDELYSSVVYMIAGDPVTGEFYVGTTDYVSTGTVYRFSADGQYLGGFDSEGVNPSKMVFLN